MTEYEIESCEDALQVLAEYLDGELDDRAPGARRGLERHLAICRSCYSRAEFEKRLKARIADGAAAVPDGLRDRMQRMIREFAVTNSPEA